LIRRSVLKEIPSLVKGQHWKVDGGTNPVHVSFIRLSYRIDIPAVIRIEDLKRSDLPKNWKSFPAPESTMAIGSNWVKKAHSVVLKVPSVVIEIEHNYLLNPLHPDFKSLRIHTAEPFSFDPRMWKKF
jgi:RES domain-containing protein